MKQLAFAFFILIINCQTELRVAQRVRGMVINDGYALTEKDEVFTLKGKKYHIRVKELFKGGELNEVKIWKPEGYLTYSKKELSEDSSLLKRYDLDAKLVVELSEKQKLSVSRKNVKLQSIDNNNKMIFYTTNNNDKTMYRLICE